MGLFTPSTFEADVEKATNEKNVSEEWSVIMEVCDKIQEAPQHSKDYLKAIFKRLNHQDPHIVMQALSLLDACVNNCGKPFHLEVASRDFEVEFRKLVGKSQPKIVEKLKSLLKKWAEGDFKNDTQLTLIPSLYEKLVKEGVDFSQVDESKPKQSPQLKDPNAVSSQKEVEDIAKAIELSLQDTTISSVTKSGASGSSSLYPSTNIANSSSEGRKVRALYDFEAAEENELTFLAGEIIQVLDDTDSSWWEGCNKRGKGLFPSNFVTDDLSVEPENTKVEKKSVQFNETVQVKTVKNLQPVEIDEAKIDRLSYLLHEADPEDDTNDSEQMLALEEEVNAMAPLIDTELERVDKKHAVLTQLSSKLVESLNIYYTLMREQPFVSKPPAAAANSPFHQPQPPPPQVFNGPVSYPLPPEHYMMGPPPPGAQYPPMGPQSLPPQSAPNQPMSFPQSGLPEYIPPFPGAHSQHNLQQAGYTAGPPAANNPAAPTNSQHL